MIDEWPANRSGFARFSDDKLFRYRLSRALTSAGTMRLGPAFDALGLRRVVFVMLNPSTADAFKLDPTVAKCVKFAQLWNADVLEVVNLFAYRSTYPEDLWRRHSQHEEIEGEANDDEILATCIGAERVIAAWGANGRLNHRADRVVYLLEANAIRLSALKLTNSKAPAHPLARGKSFIPLSTEPQPWP